jgi:hypothetical protein
MDDLLTKQINAMISTAISECFSNSLIYGTGYIKVTNLDAGVKIENIPVDQIEAELKAFIEHKKLFVQM